MGFKNTIKQGKMQSTKRENTCDTGIQQRFKVILHERPPQINQNA